MKKKTAKKGCYCVEQINKQLVPHGAKLQQDLMMSFKENRGTASMSPPRITLVKLDSNNSKKPLRSLYASFCPFCGKKVTP